MCIMIESTAGGRKTVCRDSSDYFLNGHARSLFSDVSVLVATVRSEPMSL